MLVEQTTTSVGMGDVPDGSFWGGEGRGVVVVVPERASKASDLAFHRRGVRGDKERKRDSKAYNTNALAAGRGDGRDNDEEKGSPMTTFWSRQLETAQDQQRISENPRRQQSGAFSISMGRSIGWDTVGSSSASSVPTNQQVLSAALSSQPSLPCHAGSAHLLLLS